MFSWQEQEIVVRCAGEAGVSVGPQLTVASGKNKANHQNHSFGNLGIPPGAPMPGTIENRSGPIGCTSNGFGGISLFPGRIIHTVSV